MNGNVFDSEQGGYDVFHNADFQHVHTSNYDPHDVDNEFKLSYVGANTISKMAYVFDNIRKMALFEQLVPPEAGLGWPIPLRKVGQVYITVPFFSKGVVGQGQAVLYPPFATLTLNWQNLLPMEYVDLRFRNPSEGQWEVYNEQPGAFPHAAVAHLSVQQYLEQCNMLFMMYDELLTALTYGETLSSTWEHSFSTLLRLLMEPSLERYYRILGPEFFGRFLPHAVQPS